jgi:hypothetical protein
VSARTTEQSLSQKVAVLTHDVTVLSRSVDNLASLLRENSTSLSDHIAKLSDRINVAERGHGPTWTGIAQVATLIATYTVLLSALVALYVRGEITAADAVHEQWRKDTSTAITRLQAQNEIVFNASPQTP